MLATAAFSQGSRWMQNVGSSNLSTAAAVLPVVVTSGLRIARKSPLKNSLGSNGPFGAVAIEKVGKQHNEARRSEPFRHTYQGRPVPSAASM